MARRIDPDDGVARTLAETMKKYDGVYKRGEIEAYFRDECRPRADVGADGNVPGLPAWLEERGLEDYVEEVKKWCKENGAVSLAEVEANFDEIKGSILASEIDAGDNVRVEVLHGRWNGQYLAEVLGTSSSGLRLRHKQDDFEETLPWATVGGGKYRLEPVTDDEDEDEAPGSLLRTGRLRVDPAVGAGLEVRWVKLGYVVCKIHSRPGQPDLRLGDAVLSLGCELLLGLDEEEVERRFGEALKKNARVVVGPLNGLLRRPLEDVQRETEQAMRS